MVSDRLGRNVVNGKVYAVAGECRVQDSPRAGMLALVVGNDVVHVDAADVVRIDDCFPREVELAVSGVNTSTVATQVILRLNRRTVAQGDGALIPFVRDVSLVGAAVDVSHDNGTDPGDWTLTVTKYNKNGTSIATESMMCTMDELGLTKHNMSQEEFSSPMEFIAGTHAAAVSFTGPATDTVSVHAVLLFRFDDS